MFDTEYAPEQPVAPTFFVFVQYERNNPYDKGDKLYGPFGSYWDADVFIEKYRDEVDIEENDCFSCHVIPLSSVE